MNRLKQGLLGSTIAASMVLIASPAVAQETVTPAPAPAADAAPTSSPTQPTAPTADGSDQAAIVVTGTIIRNKNAASASPITVLTSTDLANRGIITIADAIQSLSANNGGTLNSNWSQFGFPKGASAPSLRGLTDGRTLTVFDGLRSAPYPLADDGYRNFVDINTIPDSIVDRVEVLQDGASSTYGADAVAGVVNVIVKKEIQGFHANASGAISQRGDYGERRVDGTYGYGDLSSQGFNVYVNGEYQSNDALYLNDRSADEAGTANHSDECAPSNGQGSVAAGVLTCRSNGIANGIQANGSYGGFATTVVPFVRPYNANGTVVAGSTYQMLNPAAGCGSDTPYTLSAAQRTGVGASAPAVVCQQDTVKKYYEYSGRIKRFGGNAHATANIGSRAQAYAMFNFYETQTYNPLTPEAYANQTAAGGTQVTLSPLLLPTYVCPLNGQNAVYNANGTITLPGGCNAGTAGAKINPNNPFAATAAGAAAGTLARLVGSNDRPTEDDTTARSFRYTAGISGSFGGDRAWNYNLDATHSDVYLKYVSKNYFNAQDLLNAIASGSYNFVDPAANSEAAREGVSPTEVNKSVSRLTLVQGTLSHSFFSLPGGDVDFAAGLAYRKESIDNPSSNPANEANPYDRYYGINAVGVEGKRNVKSAFYEVNVPVFKQLNLNASGRYDDYSSGQKNFSPKFEAVITPVRQIKLRGTFSKGFAIPSFNEAFGLPTTGYINTQIDSTTAAGKAFIAAHGGDDYSTQSYSYGQTSVGNPSVKPEKSTSYTLGAVVTPKPWLTLTVDYYHIKIKDLITTPNCSAAVDQYYANNGVTNVAGCTTAAGVPDVNAPGALPLLGTITSVYGNANALKTRGLDFIADARIPLGNGIKLDSNFNATYLINLSKYDSDGTVERYDGSLGPCEITSCSGSPKLKGSWENTIDFNGKGTLSATVNYTSGYSLVGTDDGGIYGDCEGSIGAEVVTYLDGTTPVKCHNPKFITVDLSASIKVANKMTLYTNILNLLDKKPNFDPSAGYGLYQFNPAWEGSGFIGRYIRIGARVDF